MLLFNVSKIGRVFVCSVDSTCFLTSPIISRSCNRVFIKQLRLGRGFFVQRNLVKLIKGLLLDCATGHYNSILAYNSLDSVLSLLLMDDLLDRRPQLRLVVLLSFINSDDAFDLCDDRLGSNL